MPPKPEPRPHPGAPDLDGRLPSEKGDGLFQLYTCPSCLWVGLDPAAAPSGGASYIRSDAYRLIGAGGDPLVAAWRRAAALAELAGKPAEAIRCQLRAVWAADDVFEVETARVLRVATANAIQDMGDAARGPEDDPDRPLTLRLDLLRRAGRFDEAAVLAQQLIDTSAIALTRNIGAFQQLRIEEKDTAPYSRGAVMQAMLETLATRAARLDEKPPFSWSNLAVKAAGLVLIGFAVWHAIMG